MRGLCANDWELARAKAGLEGMKCFHKETESDFKPLLSMRRLSGMESERAVWIINIIGQPRGYDTQSRS